MTEIRNNGGGGESNCFSVDSINEGQVKRVGEQIGMVWTRDNEVARRDLPSDGLDV